MLLIYLRHYYTDVRSTSCVYYFHCIKLTSIRCIAPCTLDEIEKLPSYPRGIEHFIVLLIRLHLYTHNPFTRKQRTTLITMMSVFSWHRNTFWWLSASIICKQNYCHFFLFWLSYHKSSSKLTVLFVYTTLSYYYMHYMREDAHEHTYSHLDHGRHMRMPWHF